MNFSITITGEKHELADSLAILKAVMGDQIGAGTVTTNVQPVQPVAPVASPTMPAPTAPVAPPAAPVAPPVQAVPTASAPTYTMEQLGVAAGPLIDAGRANELTAWIHQRGAQSLSQLDPAHYGDFATYLRSLGMRI